MSSDDSAKESVQETYIDRDGLRIPPELREFDRQIVIRTPQKTIQHFGSTPLGPFYGMVQERDFGEVDDLRDPRNEHLAPNRVSIKPQGEEPTVLEVDLNATVP